MKKIFALLALCAFGLASLFAREITVSVGAGESWDKGQSPQLAIWLEDSEGNYVRTLYVTKKASQKSWFFGPKAGRPESLPVWYHASKLDPKKGASKGSSEIDAVTSATPKGGVFFSQEIGEDAYVIKAEINVSFDYNERWTKKNSAPNGQPSLIYEAEIPAGASEEIALALVGSGSIDGSDGTINPDTEGFDSALKLVKLISVSFK